MTTGASEIAEFYGSPRGAVTARLLRERLAVFWPNTKGESVLGIGYTQPFLDLWSDQAHRVIACMPDALMPHALMPHALMADALMPETLGAAKWPASGPSRSCVTADEALPFPDMVFDRVLLLHGLESASNPGRLLRETWRILKDDGRMVVVAPNRAGVWTHGEDSPFFLRQSFTSGQIDRLLAASLFRTERRDSALWLPPTAMRFFLQSAPVLERTGRRLMPGAAGVTITEAVKDVYAALPLQPAPRRRLAALSRSA